jgi:hypothetical protein
LPAPAAAPRSAWVRERRPRSPRWPDHMRNAGSAPPERLGAGPGGSRRRRGRAGRRRSARACVPGRGWPRALHRKPHDAAGRWPCARPWSPASRPDAAALPPPASAPALQPTHPAAHPRPGRGPPTAGRVPRACCPRVRARPRWWPPWHRLWGRSRRQCAGHGIGSRRQSRLASLAAMSYSAVMPLSAALRRNAPPVA